MTGRTLEVYVLRRLRRCYYHTECAQLTGDKKLPFILHLRLDRQKKWDDCRYLIWSAGTLNVTV